MKYLIIGLGNPGIEYVHTRHNVGFQVLDKFSQDLDTSFSSDRHADIAETVFKGRRLVLIKPNTFMNLSGKAVLYWLKKEKIDVSNLIIIVDDLNLDFGISRLRKSGSDGGHNGLKDISNSLNSSKFTRLRFGIGNNYKKEKQVDFVLSKWNIEESAKLKYHLDKNVEIILSSLKKGLEFTMNKYN